MPVTVTLVDHPLVADSLARIRDRDTPNSLFRTNLERIGTLLLAEATRSLRTVDGTVETPLTTATVRRLAVQPIVVPILRAGLGFVHAAQELMPAADVGFIGVSRDEETFEPKAYVNKLPEHLRIGRSSSSTPCSPPAVRWCTRFACCSNAVPPRRSPSCVHWRHQRVFSACVMNTSTYMWSRPPSTTT